MVPEIMKKLLLVLLAGSVATAAIADIQSPPGDRQSPFRKLSRAIANLVYGVSEIPSTWRQTLDTEGRNAAFAYGGVRGIEKSVVRVGYGLYELVTFPAPTYKGGYGEPYHRKSFKAPVLGYSEFPPQLGYIAEADYNRTQTY